MVDPQVQSVLDALAAMKLPAPDTLPIAEARAQYMRSRAPFLAEAESVASVEDRSIPRPGGTVPIRYYRPLGSRPGEQLPAFVFLHGGGWVFGNLDSHDALCRSLCNATACAVVAVDYRLAPEHKFPAALDDTLVAIRYLATQGEGLGIDGSRIAAGGDSAGGNLVAAAALALRDAGDSPLALQVLLYAVTDLSLASESYASLGRGYLLTLDRMRFFAGSYLRTAADAMDWRASPLQARDLGDLPPAFVLTASHDPLIGEGRAYAERLRAAGVAVTYRTYPGMIHNFMTMAGAIDLARTAIDDTAGAIRASLRA